MTALQYHDATKHHFNRFARSLGYLDWASQPDPFRRYAAAPLIELPRVALATGVSYETLYSGTRAPARIGAPAIGEFLRCSMGLSAWKQYGTSRWALRVNPSSGNLHPTEAYVVWRGLTCHYAPRAHALEQRSVLDPDAARESAEDNGSFLVALTSIHWREAWKYGERAFRYCQHDVGHAVGALRVAAALLGWRLTLLPQWSDAQLAALLGLDRAADYGDAEREEPECIALVTGNSGAADPIASLAEHDRESLVELARRATWHGEANRLSASHVDWPIIDQVAEATRYPGLASTAFAERSGAAGRLPTRPARRPPEPTGAPPVALPARDVILQRRSALGFNPQGTLRRDTFFSMLRRLLPGAGAPAVPWDAIDWAPQVHLALFVHRVEDVTPGIYAFLRDPQAFTEWKAAMRPEFLWENVNDPNDPNDPNEPNDLALFLLVPLDVRHAANRVSCDQDIAEDGFFSLAMIARVEETLRERGDWFYRRLFWECGLIGQVLYLDAEAAGARATGIGCFYDDAVHDMLGLSGHAWQSLYHFSMGLPVEDARLTTEPGYDWEKP